MLIPEVSYTDFKKLTAKQITELKSCAITSNSEVLFFAIIPSAAGGFAIKDDISIKAEYLADRMNSVTGKTLEEVKGAAIPV